MNAAQSQRNSGALNSPGRPRARQPSASTRSAGMIHGMLPANSTGAKNHHDSSRSASGVR